MLDKMRTLSFGDISIIKIYCDSFELDAIMTFFIFIVGHFGCKRDDCLYLFMKEKSKEDAK